MLFTETHSAIQALKALSHTSIVNRLTFLQADIKTAYEYDSYIFPAA